MCVQGWWWGVCVCMCVLCVWGLHLQHSQMPQPCKVRLGNFSEVVCIQIPGQRNWTSCQHIFDLKKKKKKKKEENGQLRRSDIGL